MRYFISAIVAGWVLAGCSTTATSVMNKSLDLASLTGQWQVESIDQAGIIDHSHITVQFAKDGRLSGSSGCNRYSTMMTEQDGSFSVGNTVSTRMACAPALMQQEQRFLQALQESHTVYKLSDTWLIIEDANGTPRLKMMSLANDM